MADISVILNAHREGVIVGATVRSAFEAIDYATHLHGLDIEIIAVLDKGDAVTGAALAHSLGGRGQILHVDEGDPGQSRNRGVEAASGTCIAFLDGDDLWSHNWLANAWSFIKSRPDAICHSECNVTFGKEHNVWLHIDSEGALFDECYLSWSNYWDALSFARREIYLNFPFKKNDLKRGFGHEDWHWSCMTYAAGIPHKPVPDTMHFKRRRSGSQMSLVAQSDSFVWPLERPEQIRRRAPVHLCVGAPFSGAERFLETVGETASVSTSDVGFWHDYDAPAAQGLVTAFLKKVGSTDRPTLHYEPAYAAMSAEQIQALCDNLPPTSKVLVFLRNPLDRATAEVSHRAFVQGGLRGPITDAMAVSIAKAMKTLSHPTSATAALWMSAFRDRARIIWYDENPVETLGDIGTYLNIPTLSDGSELPGRSAAPGLLPELTNRQQCILADLVLRDAYELDIQFPEPAGAWTARIRDSALTARLSPVSEDENSDIKRGLRLMESLGDNCEFGFVQRYEDYEPSSLLRWCISPIDKLINFLDAPQELFRLENVATDGSSALALDKSSGFYFHSDLVVPHEGGKRLITEQEGFASIYSVEKKKIEYFENKFFFNLRLNPGIYVYKRNSGVEKEDVIALHRALRRYNPGHILLYVQQGDSEILDILGDGLYCGSVKVFAEYTSANVVDLDSWSRVISTLTGCDDVKMLLNKAYI